MFMPDHTFQKNSEFKKIIERICSSIYYKNMNLNFVSNF